MMISHIVFGLQILLGGALNEQDVLGTIAQNIRDGGYTNCLAPNLTNCGSSCSTASCGSWSDSFRVGLDSYGKIDSLFDEKSGQWKKNLL